MLLINWKKSIHMKERYKIYQVLKLRNLGTSFKRQFSSQFGTTQVDSFVFVLLLHDFNVYVLFLMCFLKKNPLLSWIDTSEIYCQMQFYYLCKFTPYTTLPFVFCFFVFFNVKWKLVSISIFFFLFLMIGFSLYRLSDWVHLYNVGKTLYCNWKRKS